MNTKPTPPPDSLGSPSCCASFEVWIAGKPEWAETINARTAGKAKSEYHREVTESWPGISFMKVRCRKVGKPVTSERFRANAKYRGMPDVECGQRVTVNGNAGTITGHNSSANFEVLFDDDAPHYAGLKLNVHPQDVVLIRHNVPALAQSGGEKPTTKESNS